MAICLLLSSMAAWLLFSGLGASSLHDGDEALYAAVARAMKEGGDYLTPTYWGSPLLHKPPLPYWLMSLSYALVPGSVEFQARFPSALAALVLLGAVYWTARRFAGPATGAMAALLLLLNHQFLLEHASRSANFDSLLSTFIFLGLISGLRARERISARIASAFFLGCVPLIKAPMVFFPVVVVFIFHWRQAPGFALRWLGWVTAGVLLLSAPWHLYQLAIHGRLFWDTYVLYEILGRTGSTLQAEAAHPLIHLEACWRSFLPWSPLLMLALAGGITGWPQGEDKTEIPTLRYLSGYALLILLFFCLIPSKWPWYGLPAYPAVAVAGALFTHRLLQGRWGYMLPAVLGLMAVARVLFITTNPDYNPVIRPSYLWPAREQLYGLGLLSIDPLTVLLLLLIIACAALPVLLRAATPLVAVLALAAMLFGLSLLALSHVPTAHQRAASKLARILEEEGVKHVYAAGFYHVPRYGGRQDPLTSFYLLGVKNARVTDCGANLACVSTDPDTPSAVVVNADTLEPERREKLLRFLSRHPGDLRGWLLRPGTSQGVERLIVPR